MGNFSSLGSGVESNCSGDPSVALNAGLDVAGAPTTLSAVDHVMNLVLAYGARVGAIDASWNQDKSAWIYDVQSSPDPLPGNSWVPSQIAAQSSCTLPNLASRSTIWVSVRANGAYGPRLWSDPATIRAVKKPNRPGAQSTAHPASQASTSDRMVFNPSLPPNHSPLSSS